MPREGKDFELLIKKIKNILTPKGAVIKSPDYLADKITGRHREVDLSIRTQIESKPVLITVECRDRQKKNEDVTWIEQLVTKATDLEVFKTIAVSSKGFSTEAIKKANYYGIDIRIISHLNKEDIINWLSIKEVTKVNNKFSIVSVNFPHKVTLDEKSIKEFKNKFKNQKEMFLCSVDNKYHTLDQVFINLIGNRDIYSSLTCDQSKVRKDFSFVLADYTIAFKIGNKTYSIEYINFIVDLWRELVKIPISNVINYKSDKENILDRVEFNIGNRKISFNKDNKTGEIHLYLE